MTGKPYPPITDYPGIEPYDPDSPKGKEVAARLTRVLDQIEAELAAAAYALAYADVEPETVRQAVAA